MSGTNRSRLGPEEVRGIRCPACGCGHFRVVYTRKTVGQRIVRRRECRHCGRRLSTIEQARGSGPPAAGRGAAP